MKYLGKCPYPLSQFSHLPSNHFNMVSALSLHQNSSSWGFHWWPHWPPINIFCTILFFLFLFSFSHFLAPFNNAYHSLSCLPWLVMIFILHLCFFSLSFLFRFILLILAIKCWSILWLPLFLPYTFSLKDLIFFLSFKCNPLTDGSWIHTFSPILPFDLQTYIFNSYLDVSKTSPLGCFKDISNSKCYTWFCRSALPTWSSFFVSMNSISFHSVSFPTPYPINYLIP